jgi:hypothetical protein
MIASVSLLEERQAINPNPRSLDFIDFTLCFLMNTRILKKKESVKQIHTRMCANRDDAINNFRK